MPTKNNAVSKDAPTVVQRHLAIYDTHIPHNINLRPVYNFIEHYRPTHFIIGGDFLNLEWVNPVITHNDIIKEFVINEVFKEVNYKVTIKENLNKPIICVDQWEIDSKDFILDSIKSSKPFIILTERLRCNKISKKKASDRMYVTRGTGAFHKHEKRWKMLKIENAVITEKIKGMMK